MVKNDKTKIMKLAKKYYKASKQRNIFVILAIIMATFLMVVVFSIGLDFYNATREQQTLSEGTNRDIIVTNPTEQQIETAKGLAKSRYVGIEAKCGIVQECNEKQVTYRMIWKNPVNWEKQTSEGVENIVGKYPQNEDEVMMSKWLLEELGFEKYELGMEIPVTYSVEKKSYDKSFYLSGYYTDHVSLLNPGSESLLVSEEFYSKTSEIISSPSVEMGITLDSQLITESQINKIANALEVDKNQRFFYNEELINVVKLLSIAIILVSLLILLCGYLLIYNILYISFTKDVQAYGLLKTLGMSKGQMKRMLFRQVFLMMALGIPVGLLLGGTVSVIAIPIILTKLFLQDGLFIKSSISVEVFIFTVIFILVTVLISSLKPVKIVTKIPPISAIKYENITVKKKTKNGKKGAKPYKMAIYNVLCNKRKATIVYLSLFIGLTLFMIINTYTNSINKKDYVNAYMSTDMVLRNPTRNDSGNLGTQIFDKQTLKEIEAIDGVKKSQIITSDTISIGFDDELFGKYLKEFCALWMNESYEDVLEQIKNDPLNFYGCLIGVSSEQLEELGLSAEINISDFENGKICVLQTDIPIEGIKSRNINFSIVGKNEKYSLEVASVAEKNLSSYSGIAPNIYVSDKAIHNFISEPWIERMDIFYDNQYDAATENRINLVIQDTGAEVTSRIEMMENIGSFKDQLNVLGNGLAAIIAIIGVLNFANVIITNIFERKQEFLILNNIGMTQKQIRHMLVCEGIVYGVGTIFLVSTAGSLISIFIFKIVKESYMILHFPYIPVLIVFSVLIIICIALPIFIGKNILVLNKVKTKKNNFS